MAGGTKAVGDAAEARALAHLQRHGLALVRRNYRVARGPRARGGEVDLIVLDGSSVIFVEVRLRTNKRFGGAAESITAAKRRRVVLAARYYLATHPGDAKRPCRFDCILLDGQTIEWLRDAFAAD